MTPEPNRNTSFMPRFGATLIAFAAVLLISGCTKKEEPIRDYITFHAYSWEQTLGQIEQPVEVAPGRIAYARRIPLISSAQITRIDNYDVAGGKGICCHLSRHGQMLWKAASTEYGGRHTLMMIDGEFRGFVRMRLGKAEGSAFCLDGPFSEDDARRMGENAQSIYVKKHSLAPDLWKIGK